MNSVLQTNDVAIGIAKCSNGNLGVVIKMPPSPSDMADLKFDGINGIQYKIIPFEMALTPKDGKYIDSNDNVWEILDCNCE